MHEMSETPGNSCVKKYHRIAWPAWPKDRLAEKVPSDRTADRTA
jgi:hypothetical protein